MNDTSLSTAPSVRATNTPRYFRHCLYGAYLCILLAAALWVCSLAVWLPELVSAYRCYLAPDAHHTCLLMHESAYSSTYGVWRVFAILLLLPASSLAVDAFALRRLAGRPIQRRSDSRYRPLTLVSAVVVYRVSIATLLLCVVWAMTDLMAAFGWAVEGSRPLWHAPAFASGMIAATAAIGVLAFARYLSEPVRFVRGMAKKAPLGGW